MKFSEPFHRLLNCSDSEEVFQYLQSNLTNSITLWDYFVNWSKVLENFRTLEEYLNLLNCLIGKDNIVDELKRLLGQYPELICTIPVLLACRNLNFEILTSYSYGVLSHKYYDFNYRGQLSEKEINDIVEFFQKTGILEMFKKRTIKSIPDYVIGIEVGLDSNARKNRGGTTMEKIVKSQLETICQNHNWLLMPQATAFKIQSHWNINIQVDKSNRKFDFAVKNQNFLYLIETNFYGGAGSKLKSTAGEYKGLFDFLTNQGHRFIWITDGLGWKSALSPLKETFEYIDYILNLQMLSAGLLTEIIEKKL